MKNFTSQLIFAFIAMIFSTGISFAQITPGIGGDDSANSTVALPDPLTPEASRALVSTMSDQQVRELLLQRLDAVAREKAEANKADDGGIIKQLGYWASLIKSNFFVSVERLPRIWPGLKTSATNFEKKHGPNAFLKFFGIILGAIAGGLVAEFIVNRITRTRRTKQQKSDESSSLGQTVKFLGTRFFWESIALIVFFIVTRNIVQFIAPPDMVPIIGRFMVSLVVIPRWTWALSNFLYAPKRPELRLINATDSVVGFFRRHMMGVMILIGFMSFILTFNVLNGIPVGHTRLGYWLSCTLFFWFGYSTFIGREGIRLVMIGSRPEEVTPAEMRVANVFPWFAIGFYLVMWAIVQVIAGMGRFDLLGGRQYVVLLLVTFSPVMDTMIRGLVRHMVPPMSGEGVIANRAYHSTKRSYIRIGRVLMFGLVITIIAGLWQIDFENLASAGVGARFAGTLLEVLMVLAIGYLIWEVVTLLINRKLAAEMTAAGFDLDDDEPGGGEGGGVGGSRLSTVLPMIRFTLQILIASMTVLFALANTGVDITPLLAGAGVLGIAIGFGAQSLVKDVVSGVFFLVEDAFRVGEYLNINDTVGTVEKISLRSMQLRHHNGPVHTIPFGEIPKVTNMSRDWVILKLKWTLPFGTDPQKIKKLFKEIGKEMMDAEYAENIIQTFKSQGVYDVDDVGIVIRGKFMAKPGTQWIMRKDVYSRVQKKLEANGIEFARREVRVNVPGIEDAPSLDDKTKSAIGAAAQAAQPDEAKAPLPDTP